MLVEPSGVPSSSAESLGCPHGEDHELRHLGWKGPPGLSAISGQLSLRGRLRILRGEGLANGIPHSPFWSDLTPVAAARSRQARQGTDGRSQEPMGEGRAYGAPAPAPYPAEPARPDSERAPSNRRLGGGSRRVAPQHQLPCPAVDLRCRLPDCWAPGARSGRLAHPQCQEEVQLVFKAGQIAAGELLDPPHPVAQGVHMKMQPGGAARP